eukprot:COSAG01_NODE_72334_length_253_cov_0.675325_1_plen_61_part_01
MMMIGAYFVFRNQVTTPAKVAIGLAALVALAGPLIHATPRASWLVLVHWRTQAVSAKIPL